MKTYPIPMVPSPVKAHPDVLEAYRVDYGSALKEGLEKCFQRHADVAAVCRAGLRAMGFKLFPAPGAVCSPTVTAVNLPAGAAWQEFDGRLRRSGLVVGGSYGARAGKVFRLGHMGTQADMGLVRQALDVLEKEIKNLKKQGDRK